MVSEPVSDKMGQDPHTSLVGSELTGFARSAQYFLNRIPERQEGRFLEHIASQTSRSLVAGPDYFRIFEMEGREYT